MEKNWRLAAATSLRYCLELMLVFTPCLRVVVKLGSPIKAFLPVKQGFEVLVKQWAVGICGNEYGGYVPIFKVNQRSLEKLPVSIGRVGSQGSELARSLSLRN